MKSKPKFYNAQVHSSNPSNMFALYYITPFLVVRHDNDWKENGGKGENIVYYYSSLVVFIFLQYNVMHTCDKYRKFPSYWEMGTFFWIQIPGFYDVMWN